MLPTDTGDRRRKRRNTHTLESVPGKFWKNTQETEYPYLYPPQGVGLRSHSHSAAFGPITVSPIGRVFLYKQTF